MKLERVFELAEKKLKDDYVDNNLLMRAFTDNERYVEEDRRLWGELMDLWELKDKIGKDEEG